VPSSAWLVANRRYEVVTCILASATDFGADAAVFVVGGVPLALLCTGNTSRRTGFDHCAEKAEIRFGLPCDDTACDVARVSAIEAEANAASQRTYVALG
jgi:hypothetical protein